MADKTVSVQVGPGFLSLLTIVFVTLKLTGYIAWSWWYVLSPFWIPLAFVLGLFAIVFLITVVWDFVK